MCVSVIRHILSLSRNVSCFCDASISGQLNSLNTYTVGIENVWPSLFI